MLVVMLAQIVSGKVDLAEVFFLVAVILAGLAGIVREYAGMLLPAAVAFAAAGWFVL